MGPPTRFALLAIALLASGSAHAGDTSDTLTGDWGGLRTDLRAKGIEFQFGYVSETAANLRGGTRHLTDYTDQWTFGTTLDLDRLLGLPHARFQATITDRNGRNLSSDAGLNTLQQVQEVFGRGQTWRITQLWYDQSFFDGAFDWKIGRLTVGEDFASAACDFMNLTFCGAQPGNIVGDYWFNWPVSQWATRGKLALSGFGYVQLGVYEVNPTYLENGDAFSLSAPGATGALIPLELGWLPTVGEAKLPGSYKFGLWYDTSRADDVSDNDQGQSLLVVGGQPQRHRGRYGAYVAALQQVARPSPTEPDRGLSVFIRASLADRRTATLDSQIAVGMVYTGPFDARPRDEIGFAVGLTHVNDRVADAQRQQNAAGLGPVPVQQSEYAAEIYYGLHAISGVVLRPNLQFIHDPGGVSQNEDVLVIGLKAVVNF